MPALYMDEIRTKQIKSDYNSNVQVIELQKLKREKNKLYGDRREVVIKLNDITSSIDYASGYSSNLEVAVELNGSEVTSLKSSCCPFCETDNQIISSESNKLLEAINWLNSELSKTPLLVDSFESDKKLFELRVKEIDKDIEVVNEKIQKLEMISKELQKDRSIEEQALKVKLKVENMLESLLEKDVITIDENIKSVKKLINLHENELRTKFNVKKKIEYAENYIKNTMNSIGKELDFEASYQPVDLRFSLESFDLWYQKNKNEKIYLRSMGSGANWLYSHLCLFMGLHKYFCTLGKDSIVPSIGSVKLTV